MDRNFYEIFENNNTIQISWCATCQTFFLILWRYVVFIDDITNQTISQNIEKIH